MYIKGWPRAMVLLEGQVSTLMDFKLTIGIAWPSGISFKGIFKSKPAISAKERRYLVLGATVTRRV
jgi:hypothetical protein